MEYLSNIQVFTTSKDFRKYGDNTTFSLRAAPFPFFPNLPADVLHPFNTVIPNGREQPILDFLYELCTEAKIIASSGNYEVLHPGGFENICWKHNIQSTQPPVLTFTSPTSNPDHYALVVEYNKIFLAYHCRNIGNTSLAPFNHAAVSARYAASLIPTPIVDLPTIPTATAAVPQPDTAATATLEAPDSDYYDSESSYETVIHPTDDRGNVLSTYRLTSYNVAAKNWNYKQEKLKLADPTYTYTPREIKVAPVPRKRPPKRRRPNNSSY